MLNFPKWKVVLVSLTCLAGILFAMPNFVPSSSPLARFLPQSKVSLGLDLQGGSHLLLEVDSKTYLKEQLESLVDDVRAALRKENIGYRDLKANDSAVSFELRNPADSETANKRISSVSRDLLTKNAGGKFTVSYSEEYLREQGKHLVEQSIEIVRRRVDETGTKEPIIQMQGENRILLQVPGLSNPGELKNLLGKTAKLTFHRVADDGGVLPGYITIPDERGEAISLEKRPILTGEQLVNAGTSFEHGLPAVSFKFNSQGARKFGDVTAANVGKRFAIVLDNKVISAPVIREPILGGSGIISGNFTVESANELALLLRAGALPAPLQILEERSIGPSLGADSIEAGKKATLISVALVIVFMIVAYGLFGFFSVIAVFINMLFIISCLSLFGSTLTLPGIAGIVLTVGMAVDANVLIFERIREEAVAGKSPIASIDQGFNKAFSTILDSNLTTIAAALLLYQFGTGPIKGFAVTLTIGILTSMFTAILVTKLMIIWWLKAGRPKTIPL